MKRKAKKKRTVMKRKRKIKSKQSANPAGYGACSAGKTTTAKIQTKRNSKIAPVKVATKSS